LDHATGAATIISFGKQTFKRDKASVEFQVGQAHEQGVASGCGWLFHLDRIVGDK
jgi:hypothetical protein